jgi:hypothetical protein
MSVYIFRLYKDHPKASIICPNCKAVFDNEFVEHKYNQLLNTCSFCKIEFLISGTLADIYCVGHDISEIEYLDCTKSYSIFIIEKLIVPSYEVMKYIEIGRIDDTKYYKFPLISK